MAIYQNSVLKKHLASQDAEAVKAAYAKYAAYFLNKEVQENIRNAKEEQFQQKFLMELFVNILGYVMNPDAGFNITTELKNIKDAKKTDGAILLPSPEGEGSGVRTAIAVIELKGTDTKDLDKVNDQAFNYKNNQPDCVYVITSNFEKLRFFIHNAVEHIEFNLFTLSEDKFALLWLFLQKDNLLGGIPAKVKEESLLQEDKITKALYADYSAFKNDLWNNMVQGNPQHDPLLLYKKSQKLLDRFLFIFFSEDKGLLPPNSISVIVEQWQKLKDLDEYKPLYDRFKKYFGYMNDGYKGAKYEIHAYNGGLFKVDEHLDNLLIDDELLKKHCLKLTNYDFADEVDTNILGHIFEHSLNDIENVRAQLAGEEVDKSKTKRKKDGVFYTPKYITKYIVDNTVGKLCEEKKAELEIDESAFAKDRKGRKKATILKLDAQLKAYREWLLQLTICDPACGSGAFLNQALEFLMAEHRYVDELEAQLFEGSIVFQDVENHILENNIYGVDINEESVEIARLSLWLRTAQKGRKLTSLSSNIKCGNSLIDDPEVAGDLAFNWQKEFPQVFNPSLRGTKQSGFDVVIGNPPYVRQELFKELKPALEKHYACYNSVADLYTYFIEKGIHLMNSAGKFSFILPNKFLKATYGKNIRAVIKEHTNLELLFDFDDYPVFEDATTYPIIYVLNKKSEYEIDHFIFSEINKRSSLIDPLASLEAGRKKVPFDSLQDDMWNFIDAESFKLIEKLGANSVSLSDFVSKKIYRGLTTGKNDAFIIDSRKKEELTALNPKNAERIKVLATGKEVKRNSFNFQDNYLIFTGYSDDIPNDYPDLMREIDTYKDALIKRYDQGENYWNLRACAYYEDMEKPKIIYPRINSRGNFFFDEEGEVYLLDNNFFISSDSKALLALLNSQLVLFYLKNVCTTLQGGFYDFRRDKVSKIPISKGLSQIDASLSDFAESLIASTKGLAEKTNSLLELLQSKFDIPKPSKKLQDWPSLDFKGFLAELKKAKVPPLGLEEEAEWMGYFNKKKTEANALQSEIDRIDRQIDQMVYELYGLSEEEIGIVEQA